MMMLNCSDLDSKLYEMQAIKFKVKKQAILFTNIEIVDILKSLLCDFNTLFGFNWRIYLLIPTIWMLY